MALANTVATDADRAAYVKPAKKEQKTGSKKAERKAARLAEMKAASEEKAKRREKQLKEESAAQKRKAKEAEEAAKAEAAEGAGGCCRITIHARDGARAIRPYQEREGAPDFRGSFALEGCYPERKPRIVPAVIPSERSACIFDDNLKR